MATLIDAGAADARRSYLGGIITSVVPYALLMHLPLISGWHYNLRGAVRAAMHLPLISGGHYNLHDAVHAANAPAAHIGVAYLLVFGLEQQKRSGHFATPDSSRQHALLAQALLGLAQYVHRSVFAFKV